LRQLVIAGNSPPTAFGKCLAHASLVEYRVFGPAAAVMAHGASLSDALQSRAEKLGIAELFLLAAIFRAHARYGGDLSAILGHFEENLLNRLRAMREFAALTAEVDMTSNILLGLPIFALFGIFSVKADYFRFFLDTPGGRMALLYVVLSLFCGFLIVRRMTHISY
jgi:Flp pilus assembly protein TadB